MPILNIPQALVDELFAVARNAQEVAIPHEVIRNSIISAIDRFRGLEELADPQAILAELREENTIQQGVITEFRIRLDEARGTQNALTAATTAVTAAAAAAEAAPRGNNNMNLNLKIPDPEKYKGDRDKLRTFLTQLRLKAALYPDDQSKLRYAVSLLEDCALDQITPHIEDDRIDLDDLAELIGILETTFGDPDRVAIAERKLRSLRQANWDFSTYYAEFIRYAADTNWNEAAKRLQLEEGLCHELKNDLIVRDESELFADFVTLLQKLDQKRRRLTASAQGRKAASTTQTASATHTHTSTGAYTYAHSYTHTPTATKTTATATTASGVHPGPMNLSAGRKKLTPEERARRLAEGRCLYCSGVGHVARDCPNAHRHPLRAAEGALVPHKHNPTAAAAAAENAAHLN